MLSDHIVLIIGNYILALPKLKWHRVHGVPTLPDNK